ncbi:MAG: extracellular solute-binding protein [Cellulosilyticaceae bacterium]
MKRLMKKCLCLMLGIIVGGISLGGCQKEQDIAEEQQCVTGRYVEKEVQLPEDIKDKSIFQIDTDQEGSLVLYTTPINQEEQGIYVYTKEDDGVWEETTLEWLKDIVIGEWFLDKKIWNTEEGQYFYNIIGREGRLYDSLLKTVDGIDREEMLLEGLRSDEAGEEIDRGLDIEDVEILKNGNLLIIANGTMTIYEPMNYKVVEKVEYEREAPANEMCFTPTEKGYFFLQGFNDNGNPTEVSYFGDTGVLEGSVSIIPPKVMSTHVATVSGDGATILGNSDGIHYLAKGAKLWETVVEGNRTALGQPSLYPQELIEGKSGEYYILYGTDNNTSKVMHYAYDPEVLAVPNTELTIYALNDNFTIRQAISQFSRDNPNVKVTFRIMMQDGSSDNAGDYIKVLNTEMLAGKGPDILVLDGLPVTDYIEKGALLDLSDVMIPMVEGGELLGNIIKASTDEDGIYAVPTRYILPIFYGEKDVILEAENLEGLTRLSERQVGKSVMGEITYNDLFRKLLLMELEKVMDEKGQIKEAEMTKLLTTVKKIGDNINCLTSYGDLGQESSIFDLTSKTDLAFAYTAGGYAAAFGMAVVDYIGEDFIVYDKSFVPYGEIGINVSTTEPTLAKEFVKTVMGVECQGYDFYEGFPVSVGALEKWEKEGDAFYQAGIDIKNADGTYSPLQVTYPKDAYMEKLAESCRMVNRKKREDNKLIGMIQEECKTFFEGKITAEAATTAIINRTKMYLAE